MREPSALPWTLSTLPRHLRQIALWVAITLTIGYSTGLLFVYHTTSLSAQGAEERYRGNEPPEGKPPAPDGTSQEGPTDPLAGGSETEMKFEKSFAEMLNITHTHILALASFLALAATIFAFASRPSTRLKSILIVEPFVAIVVSFAAMWLMRYAHPSFSYLLMASSTSMAICFYLMMYYSFREILSRAPAIQPSI